MSGAVQSPQAGRPARRGMRPHTVKERHRLYLVARVAIERHYQRSLTLEALASILATSPRQIQRAFKQFGERTFQAELLARRMSVAAELLSQPTVPLQEVAVLVGYRRGSHFARTFRRCHGVSPSAYRRRAANRMLSAPRQGVHAEAGRANALPFGWHRMIRS